MNDITTPAPEVKEEQNPQEVTPQETVGEVLKEEPKIPGEIPYYRFKEKVDENTQLKEKIAELEKNSANMTQQEVQADLRTIADEHNLDANVLGKIASAIEARAQQKIDEKLRPLAEAQSAERREKLFNDHLSQALENNPQFKDVANPEVIKSLAFNPANAKKTFSQLLEMAYGKAVEAPGRKTLEQTTPRGGAENKGIDYKRAQNDSEYFKELMSDPTAKSEYNSKMMEDLSRYL
jgi:hypothetical protein